MASVEFQRLVDTEVVVPAKRCRALRGGSGSRVRGHVTWMGGWDRRNPRVISAEHHTVGK